MAQAETFVPGTEILLDTSHKGGKDPNALLHLQHAKHGDSHLLLVPQPSLTDPNDPLRWSRFKKWLTLFNGLWYSFNGAVTGPIMAAGMIPLTIQFNTTLQRLTYANGATLVCQGVATVIWMPFAVKYGRRPVYLASNLLMMVACLWLGAASTGTYGSFITGRAFLGIFEAPIESIVPSTVTDLFFLHERGEKVSLYGLAVLGGNEIGPLLSAFIIQALGMGWAFYIVATWIAASFVLMFFSMPETKYTRARPSITGSSSLGEDVDTKFAVDHHERSEQRTGSSPASEEGPGTTRSKRYFQSLAFWSKGDPNVNLFHAFIRPFILVFYPTVLWSSFVYGMSLSWNVILGATVAQLFAPPPYLFSSGDQGLVFLSPLIGSLIGTYLCGPVADMIALRYTKRNDGIREPEMRLPTCIIAAVITFLGALMLGLTYHYRTHWAGPVVGYGVLSAGAQMGATLAMSYSLDCHKELSVELMVTISSIKSLIAWIWTWCINEWIVSSGVLTVFLVIGAINVAVYFTTILMWLYGKRIRVWIHNTPFLAAWDFEGKIGRMSCSKTSTL